MFYAIKSMYSVTKCVFKFGQKLPELFQTYTWIKHGAPSSVTLFVVFMDEFIDIVREKCVEDGIIENIHINFMLTTRLIVSSA